MSAIALLVFQQLPTILNAIGILKKVPEAVDTVKGLVQYGKNVIETIKSSEPLTQAQEDQLDDWLETLSEQEHWKTDAEK